MPNQICFKAEISGLEITLTQQHFDRFTVQYFKQIKSGLNYDKAAMELGTCIMHAAALDGKLDNRFPSMARKDGDTKPYFRNPTR